MVCVESGSIRVKINFQQDKYSQEEIEKNIILTKLDDALNKYVILKFILLIELN